MAMDVQSRDASIYTEALKLAHGNNQTVGEKNDYYITLEQLERLFLGKKRATEKE